MGYLNHFHEIESNFTATLERIMRED